MQIQPITNQPSFNGKVVYNKGNGRETFYISRQLSIKFKEIANLVKDKDYDLFVFENKQNPEFYDVAANKTLEQAKAVKEYTVKVKTDIMPESIVDAAKEAMDMYEKFIAKGIKG